MKRMSLPTFILTGILLSLCFSCKEAAIPPAIEEPEEEVPADDGKFEIPDGPYEYDDALNHDAEAFLSAYQGMAHNGPHVVPGTIEAEDFDDGPVGSDGFMWAPDCAYYPENGLHLQCGVLAVRTFRSKGACCGKWRISGNIRAPGAVFGHTEDRGL